MVQHIKIEYDQCDCNKGRLELIAATTTFWARGFGTQREYFGCDKCYRIYERKIDRGPYMAPNISEFFMYKGKLTREEIKAFAHNGIGEITDDLERKIINERQKLAALPGN